MLYESLGGKEWGYREKSTEIIRVTGALSYLDQGFRILALGNWCDGPEGGGHMGGIWKVEATGQYMVDGHTEEI